MKIANKIVNNIIGKDKHSKNFKPKGHKCDKCGKQLSNDDYESYGSWSYTCPKCGYKYEHT